MPKRRSKRGGAAPYKMGARFEQTVRDAVERMGGWSTIRSAGSHDAIDILAWRPSHRGEQRVLAIQCKRDGAISPEERSALVIFGLGLATEFYAARSHNRQLQLRDITHWVSENWQDLTKVV